MRVGPTAAHGQATPGPSARPEPNVWTYDGQLHASVVLKLRVDRRGAPRLSCRDRRVRLTDGAFGCATSAHRRGGREVGMFEVVGWTIVVVFIATTAVTLLALVGALRIEPRYLNVNRHPTGTPRKFAL